VTTQQDAMENPKTNVSEVSKSLLGSSSRAFPSFPTKTTGFSIDGHFSTGHFALLYKIDREAGNRAFNL
jgi:hypothetical protein